MDDNQKPGVGIGIIVYDPSNQNILVGRRRKDKQLIAFPGGHLEKYESLQQCSARELVEETLIDIDESQFQLFEMVNSIRKEFNYHYICIFMVSFISNKIPVNTEPQKHEDWQWMNESQIKQFWMQIYYFYTDYLYQNLSRLLKKLNLKIKLKRIQVIIYNKLIVYQIYSQSENFYHLIIYNHLNQLKHTLDQIKQYF